MASGALTNNDWRLARWLLSEDANVDYHSLLMAIIDVDGDGTSERVVSGRQNGKMGELWMVFGAPKDSRCQPVGDLNFRSDACGVFIEPDFSPNPRLFVFRPTGGGGDKGVLVAFNRSGDLLEEILVKEGSWEEYHTKFLSSAPHFEKRSTAELIADFPPERLEDIAIVERGNALRSFPMKANGAIRDSKSPIRTDLLGETEVTASANRNGNGLILMLTWFGIGLLIVFIAILGARRSGTG